MALNANNALEAFIDRISRNSDIMNILKLPTITNSDSSTIKNKKRKLLIDKVITKTAQVPEELGKNFPEIVIDNIAYKNFIINSLQVCYITVIILNKTRITICEHVM